MDLNSLQAEIKNQVTVHYLTGNTLRDARNSVMGKQRSGL